MVRPSHRREMAQRAVQQFATSIRLACDAFGISEKCYRYQAKLNSDNQQIAHWLLRLTRNQQNWGLGLCYLYLRNVNGFTWNHKRIYRELELNMRIKPRNRTVRDDWLAHHLFDSVSDVQDFATRWLWTYHHERPNMALGGMTPIQKIALAA